MNAKSFLEKNKLFMQDAVIGSSENYFSQSVLRDWFFSRQKQIEKTEYRNRKAVDHDKEYHLDILQAEAWREILEAIK